MNIEDFKAGSLKHGFETKGMKSILWDGLDDRHNKVLSGLYFYQIQEEGFGGLGGWYFLVVPKLCFEAVCEKNGSFCHFEGAMRW